MKLEGPSAEHWFGTDAFGRDVLSRVIWGARVSLRWHRGHLGRRAHRHRDRNSLRLLRGIVDKLITAATDVLLSFPQLIMGLILVAVLGPTLFNLILAITITAVPAFIRVARGSTLAMKERDFVDACRALGFGDLRIMFLHVLPNIMDEVVVMGSLWLAAAIRTESTLAFIGLGVPPPTATWGGIIREDSTTSSTPLAIDLPEPCHPGRDDRPQSHRRRPSRRHRPAGAAVSAAAANRRDHGRWPHHLDPHRRPLVRRRARRELRGPAVRRWRSSASRAAARVLTALSVMGLLPAGVGRISSGRIMVDGVDMTAADEAGRQAMRGDRIGMIFQEPMTSLNPVLPVGFQIAEALIEHRG